MAAAAAENPVTHKSMLLNTLVWLFLTPSCIDWQFENVKKEDEKEVKAAVKVRHIVPH